MKMKLLSTYHQLSATVLISVVTVATSSGQVAPTWDPHTKKPLEKYDNAPAPYIYRIETSPRMISQFGGFLSYQANVDQNGNNILGDAANECSISVDPTNGARMAIGWRQFNDVSSNFRQGGWGYSTDGGMHWTFPGVLQNTFSPVDPVTTSNELGTSFYLGLKPDQPRSFSSTYLCASTTGAQIWGGRSPT